MQIQKILINLLPINLSSENDLDFVPIVNELFLTLKLRYKLKAIIKITRQEKLTV